MATGQWLAPDDGPRWWYDSGSLSLDFALTGPEEGEQLHAPADLQHWLAERFDRLGDDTGDRDLTDALGLRTALLRLARAAVDDSTPEPDDIDTVNLFAATPDVPPALEGGNRQAGRSRVRAGQALATIARDAVDLLGHADGRIRECEADDCALIFYDGSRTNNRRWCSMQRCGNRAKVRAYRSKGQRS